MQLLIIIAMPANVVLPLCQTAECGKGTRCTQDNLRWAPEVHFGAGRATTIYVMKMLMLFSLRKHGHHESCLSLLAIKIQKLIKTEICALERCT